MTGRSSRQNLTWEVYEQGRRYSQGSLESESSQPNPVSPSATSAILRVRSHGQHGGGDELRHRRSSLSMGISSLRQVGGVNSMENFARSYQRAAGFHEITPVRRGSVTLADLDDVEEGQGTEESVSGSNNSLLGQQFESEGRHAPSQFGLEEEPDQDPPEREGIKPIDGRLPSAPNNGILSFASPSPLGRSLTSSYGTAPSRGSDIVRHRASEIFHERQGTRPSEPDKETEPLLVKQVQRLDGTRASIVVGQSTLYQTIFNSVNTLIGVGLLSLPLGLKYAGWVIGVAFLIVSAAVTGYTAKILSTCLDVDGSLVTYADVAYVSFGRRARVVVSLLFSIELLAACVALVVLFADSLNALVTQAGVSILGWKLMCGMILIPLNFIPLRLLSITSVVGILCCTSIVLIVLTDGVIKPHAPGSLREPATSHLFPTNWATLPLSLGLLMSPWGGHSVFPNIYRDMRHPLKYGKGLKYTYGFVLSLDACMAIIGLLMFGDEVRDEVTSSVLLTKGYPRFLSVTIVVTIAIIPLTKIPLTCRPVVSTIEILSGLDPRTLPSDSQMRKMSNMTRKILSAIVKVAVTAVIVLIAIAFPSFDSIMALMGSCLCFTICVILPVAFYLKIFGKEIALKERIFDWFLLVSCSIMAVVGTVWAFLPKDRIGAR